MIITNSKKLINLSFIVIIFFVAGCRFDVPIQEMIKAKTAITRAKEVKADKYDPENLDKAINHLYKCHKRLKEKKSKEGKEEAIKSFKTANLAISNSLPKLSSDTLEKAKDLFSQAEKLYAEKFAPENFEKSKTLIEESEALNASAAYWVSYLKSMEAIEAAGEAKNKSIDNIPKLKGEINRITEETEQMKNHPSSATIQKEITEIESRLEFADKSLLENDIKPAFENITEASKILEQTKQKFTILDARERIKQLRQEAEELKNKRGADFSSEELEKVFSHLNEADTLLDEENSNAAIKKITEAEEALLAAKQKTLKGIAEERLKNVEKLYNEASTSSKKDELKEQLDKASTLITDAKDNLQNQLYEDSIKKSDEAETILNSIYVSKEKDHLGDQDSVSDDSDILQVYVVIYNKNKRDCLWRIALKVYRNAKLWPLIYVANKNQIKDPDLIFPGQRFKIPAIPGKKEKSIEEKVESEEKNPDGTSIEEGKKEPEGSEIGTENKTNTDEANNEEIQ